jgi:uncharacterized protein YegP (UPF0339 family)
MLIYSVYKAKKGEWRWNLKAGNGRIIADSAESYINRSDCLDAIALVKSSATAPVTRPLDSNTINRIKALRLAAQRSKLG